MAKKGGGEKPEVFNKGFSKKYAKSTGKQM